MYNTTMNNFKVKIEIDEQLNESEVVIRCREADESVIKLQKLISAASDNGGQISFFKNDTEFFLPLDNVLFFETDGGIIRAHTADDEFDVKFKLYELEDKLPRSFMRVSKSTILNIREIFTIDRSLYSSSIVSFRDTHKQVFVSRHYYKTLTERLESKT